MLSENRGAAAQEFGSGADSGTEPAGVADKNSFCQGGLLHSAEAERMLQVDLVEQNEQAQHGSQCPVGKTDKHSHKFDYLINV